MVQGPNSGHANTLHFLCSFKGSKHGLSEARVEDRPHCLNFLFFYYRFNNFPKNKKTSSNYLSLDWLPPPQDTLHVDHSDQGPNSGHGFSLQDLVSSPSPENKIKCLHI